MKNIFFIFNILLSAQILAETLTIGSFPIPQYVKDSKTGEFIALTKNIASRQNIDIKIVVHPPKRIIKMFAQGELDGFFPGLDSLLPSEVNASIPFYYKKDFLFFHKDKKTKSLSNKKICLTHGYPYSKEILTRKDVSFHYSHSDESCLKMILRKRVDGFICEGFTGISALEKMSLKHIQVKRKPISSSPVFYAFQNNQKGKRASNLFSKEIKAMYKSGELENIFKVAKKKVKKHLGNSYNPTQK